MKNPFDFGGAVGSAFFCNRTQEIDDLQQMAEAGLLFKEGQGRYQKTDPRETSETSETMRLSPQTLQKTPILVSHAGETFDETSATQPEANGSRSQSLTPKSQVDETINSPDGVKKGQSLKVSQVSLSQTPTQPHLAFYRGQRVRTPEGEGEILQYFRDQITVRLGARAAQFVPSVVIPLDETPS